MAVSVNLWLSQSGILDKLKKNGKKYANVSDSKSILTVFEQQVFIWDDVGSCVVTTQLKPPEIIEKESYKALMLTNSPVFEVECLSFNRVATLLALIGKKGVMVVEMPWKWGTHRSLGAPNETILCRTWNIAERFFVCTSRVTVIQATWHPGSFASTDIVILSSDNYIRIYDVTRPQSPPQVVSLDSNSKCYYLSSTTKVSFSSSLGESAVSFDFGQPDADAVSEANLEGYENRNKTLLIWPIFVLRGNGDVYVVKLTVNETSYTPKIEGPLAMYPPAEDNYGVDACSLLYLHGASPVLIIATASGMLYHCLLLSSSGVEDKAENSWNTSDHTESGIDVALYVYESVELSVSLTQEEPDDAYCHPLRLHKDPTSRKKYHCTHVTGLHTVALPFLAFLEEYAKTDGPIACLPQYQGKECIVEHLLCTRPLSTVDVVPVLGFDVAVTDTGAIIICLLASWEFACLPLVSSFVSSMPSLLSSKLTVSKPHLETNQENSFEQHIRHLLHRSMSTPLLKSHMTADESKTSPQQLLELLCNTTQRFREEYVQRLHAVQAQVECRVKILMQQKEQQIKDIERSLKEKESLRNAAERLAEKYEDSQSSQQKLIGRIEKVLQHLQHRLPALSDAEVNMKRELITFEEKLKEYNNSLEQIRTTQTYQNQKFKERESNAELLQGSETELENLTLGETQLKHLREILLQEGHTIAELMKKMNMLKKDAGL